MAQIRRILIANRGEIASRIISTARELNIETIAIYTDGDVLHAYNATKAVRISSSKSYIDIEELLSIALQHKVDAVHAGYGFLSESAEFARKLQDSGITFIGPSVETLRQTGDKLQARKLATGCNVPVLAGIDEPTNKVEDIRAFAQRVGYPVMVKAVDGGGGRGIRLLRSANDESLIRRAIDESPSKLVFVEQAAVDGFRHVEVQIVGDDHGNVKHLWERECSIQRRYQKLIEVAPSTAPRRFVQPLIQAALKMAIKIGYRSLGTFEFLLNPASGAFYFLEINPRIQVEHTITEFICNIDLVKIQLQIAQGSDLDDTDLNQLSQDPLLPPRLYSIQSRLTAEDTTKNWTISTGQISSHHFPKGNGIRVDTAILDDQPCNVSADFDSLVAKIITTASSWQDVVAKAQRALRDVRIRGIQTNLYMLLAMLSHEDFLSKSCDTQWLESNQEALLRQAQNIEAAQQQNPLLDLLQTQSTTTPSAMLSQSSSNIFRKGDAWTIALRDAKASSTQSRNHLQLTKVLKNDFPTSISAHITFTDSSQKSSDYIIDVNSTTASASAVTSQHKMGDPSKPGHVIIPFAGKLVEICVDEGDTVRKNDCVAVVQQMKMELEVRSQLDGRISWICDVDDGEDVVEGLLVAVVDPVDRSKL